MPSRPWSAPEPATSLAVSSFPLCLLRISRACADFEFFRGLRVFSRAACFAFFVGVILRYALGGWELGWYLLWTIGPPAWIALGVVLALVLYGNEPRIDLPLFIAGLTLGYWGEWWGTTRGVWTYWNGQTPPDYLPPLWGVGLLTVYHLQLLITALAARFDGVRRTNQRYNPRLRDCSMNSQNPWRSPVGSKVCWIKAFRLIALPALALALSAPRLASIDWSTRLDLHFFAGVFVGIVLVFYRMDIQEAFGIYVCGMLLGGTYEWLGTWMREWSYITGEVPPVWIVPLWGLACVAMVRLARWSSALVALTCHRLREALLRSSTETS